MSHPDEPAAANRTRANGGVVANVSISNSSDGRGGTSAAAVADDDDDNKNDNYCWICHAGGDVICCDKCPRVYHNKCMPSTGGGGSGSGVGVEDDEAEWTCVECEKATEAARLGAEIAKFTRDRFYVILEQMVNHLSFEDSRPFQEDVDLVKFSNYSTYVFRPTSLATLRRRVAARDYASFEAMRQDLKWILHNCIVYNGATSKLTPIAKSLLTIFESDVLDINTCADCFLHMMTGDVHDWFTEPCEKPHLLVWSKMRGYPYWPGKILGVRQQLQQQASDMPSLSPLLDIRFFGMYDRCLVSAAQCHWLSEEPPTPYRRGLQLPSYLLSLEQLNKHVGKLTARFGSFRYAAPKSSVDMRAPYQFVALVKDEKKHETTTTLVATSSGHADHTRTQATPDSSGGGDDKKSRDAEKHGDGEDKDEEDKLVIADDDDDDGDGDGDGDKTLDSSMNDKCEADMAHEESISLPAQEQQEQQNVSASAAAAAAAANVVASESLPPPPATTQHPPTTTTPNEATTVCDEDLRRERKMLRLKRIEKRLLKQKKQLDLNEQQQQQQQHQQAIKIRISLSQDGVAGSSLVSVNNNSLNSSSSSNNVRLVQDEAENKQRIESHPSTQNAIVAQEPSTIDGPASKQDDDDKGKGKEDDDDASREEKQQPIAAAAAADVLDHEPSPTPIQSNSKSAPTKSSTTDTVSPASPSPSLNQQQQQQQQQKTVANPSTTTATAPATTSAVDETLDRVINCTDEQFVAARHASQLAELRRTLELEAKQTLMRVRQTYEQLISEIKANTDVKIKEIISECRMETHKMRADYERRIKENKLKQWCAQCGNEANYYCCWNTAYCDEECQKKHWSRHYQVCSRIKLALASPASNIDTPQSSSVSSSSSSASASTTATTSSTAITTTTPITTGIFIDDDAANATLVVKKRRKRRTKAMMLMTTSPIEQTVNNNNNQSHTPTSVAATVDIKRQQQQQQQQRTSPSLFSLNVAPQASSSSSSSSSSSTTEHTRRHSATLGNGNGNSGGSRRVAIASRLATANSMNSKHVATTLTATQQQCVDYDTSSAMQQQRAHHHHHPSQILDETMSSSQHDVEDFEDHDHDDIDGDREEEEADDVDEDEEEEEEAEDEEEEYAMDNSNAMSLHQHHYNHNQHNQHHQTSSLDVRRINKRKKQRGEPLTSGVTATTTNTTTIAANMLNTNSRQVNMSARRAGHQHHQHHPLLHFN